MTTVTARRMPAHVPFTVPRRDRNEIRAFIHPENWWTGPKRFWDKAWTQRIKGQLPGSHVLDRVDLRKAIMLCQTCIKKFNYIKAGFVCKRNLPFAQGQCDGCLQFFPKMRLMVHHTIVSNL